MGTKYRLSVKTAALAGVAMFLLAGCVQISQWEDTLQQPREWDGCALGGALIGAAIGGIGSYFVADQTGGDTNRDNVKAVYIPIFTILGGGLGAVAGHYICDPIIPPPPPAPVVAEAPPPPPPPPPAPQERIVLRGVHFDFNRSNIRPDAVPILDEAADILSKHPDVTVDVNGYCDIIGSYPYNLRLSQRRANSVARYLEGKGIAPTAWSRMVTARLILSRPTGPRKAAPRTGESNWYQSAPDHLKPGAAVPSGAAAPFSPTSGLDPGPAAGYLSFGNLFYLHVEEWRSNDHFDPFGSGVDWGFLSGADGRDLGSQAGLRSEPECGRFG